MAIDSKDSLAEQVIENAPMAYIHILQVIFLWGIPIFFLLCITGVMDAFAPTKKRSTKYRPAKTVSSRQYDQQAGQGREDIYWDLQVR